MSVRNSQESTALATETIRDPGIVWDGISHIFSSRDFFWKFQAIGQGGEGITLSPPQASREWKEIGESEKVKNLEEREGKSATKHQNKL